ncbi:hypothetical protein M0E82_08700 [Corynebacterium sp. P7202]|uniref:Secreted protein n=1 Tax=Corynebacterium pygosceleis TaxID=2800406 RepID=A0A9Q4C9A2_9CORY|nr:hypothetical protein [Corynebacterium pygosceleis]MCK7638073.1 hypothetical protein [Corynebacterium pygosceleis]MCX7444372.1 hypothetical protein [Corynebacterium pygosceleis]MCX7468789.1 hypothetical protein [Corynebacterium pygosceleis]
MFSKRLVTAAATVAIATAGLAAPASADETEFRGFLFGDLLASAIPCEDVESVLTDAGILKKDMTEAGLRKAINDKNTAIVQQLYGSPDATAPVSEAQARELAKRAKKCDLVKKEDADTVIGGAGFGSSEITKIIQSLVKLLNALNPTNFRLDKILELTAPAGNAPALSSGLPR